MCSCATKEDRRFFALIEMVCWIALGGGIGTLVRYALGCVFDEAFGVMAGIWLANLLGCVCIGFLSACHHRFGVRARYFWNTGFCGGLTTFSAVNVHSMALVADGRFFLALFEVGAMAFLCVLCVLIPRMLFKEKERV